MNQHTAIQSIEHDQRQRSRDALMRQVLDGLRRTIQLRGMTPETHVDDVRVDFTDESARLILPLIEAVDILEAIIWASDGCVGHRQCAHSMEPWQRARALLQGKWEAQIWPDKRWPAYESDAEFRGEQEPRS